MAPQFVFTMQNLRKAFGKREILKDVTLAFLPDAKIGVIGNNGAGKSTLLRIMAGVDTEFDGHAAQTEGVTIGYVPQEPTLDPTKNVLGNIEEAVAPIRALLKKHEELSEKLGEPLDPDAMQAVLDKLERAQTEIEHKDAWELDRHLELAMEALRLPPADADVTKLSGGEKRRVALCRALLAHPDLLLLDEPTNHLDAETVAWLERHLGEYKGCVILITHDRYFLDNVVNWMLEIEYGCTFPYEGNYSAYLEQKATRLAIKEKADAARQKVLARELEWVRSNSKARTTKSKSRLANYDRLLTEQLQVTDDGEVDLQIPPGPRLGDKVLSIRGLRKGYGDRTLIEDFDFDFPPGAIVGIIGPNGVGKSTLIRMIAGEEKPDDGSIELGTNTLIAHVDQSRESLDGKNTIFEEITGGVEFIPFGTRKIHGRGYVARFNFRGPDQEKKVATLSGGERNRVQLAKLLRRGANLILLDEPTNDLDLDTLRVLEEAIQNFAGSAMVVTHDRWFLNRVATHIIAFEGNGRVRWFEGNYEMYAERRKEEMAAAGERESTAGKYRPMPKKS
ncbi:MAG: energy-dependent translational throttle protein EttA [Planctomycetes bacterium]|nr:energy-dependent translational throttle protein EttA [Planctomycetota bacterium]